MSVSFFLIILLTILFLFFIIRHLDAKDTIEAKKNIELQLIELRSVDSDTNIDEDSYKAFLIIKMNFEVTKFLASEISRAIQRDEHIDFHKHVNAKHEYKRRKDICIESLKLISDDLAHAVASANIISFLLIALAMVYLSVLKYPVFLSYPLIQK